VSRATGSGELVVSEFVFEQIEHTGQLHVDCHAPFPAKDGTGSMTVDWFDEFDPEK